MLIDLVAKNMLKSRKNTHEKKNKNKNKFTKHKVKMRVLINVIFIVKQEFFVGIIGICMEVIFQQRNITSANKIDYNF